MSRSEIKEILTKYKTIAVVGLSRELDKDSHRERLLEKMVSASYP